MKPSEAAKEIRTLLKQGAQLGAREASPELLAFLEDLAKSPGLKKPVNRSRTSSRAPSSSTSPRVGPSTERAAKVDMSKTIDELAQKLRDAFNSDDRFETVLNDPQTQKLSKANVVSLYNRVFDEPRPLSKSMTKPDIFNAIRRERISTVRSGY